MKKFLPLAFLIGLVILGVFYSDYSSKKEQKTLIDEDAHFLEYCIEDELYVENPEIANLDIHATVSSEKDSSVLIFIRMFDKFDSYSKEKKAYVAHEISLSIKEALMKEISQSPIIENNGNLWYITLDYETNSKNYSEYEHTLILDNLLLQDYE